MAVRRESERMRRGRQRSAESYERCRQLHREHGRSYYLATRLLPAWKRPHVHALYGFTRYADEIVDRTEDRPPQERAARLDDWADAFVAGLPARRVADPLLPAVLHTIDASTWTSRTSRTFLRSMAMDLKVTGYATYDDLLGYMEGSAAVIGTMMLPILGVVRSRRRRPRAGPAARLRLPAHQLHPGRREDLDRGRVYLPEEDLAGFGVTATTCWPRRRARRATPPVRRADRYEVAGARRRTTRPPRRAAACCRPRSRLCMRTAYLLYGGILDEVARADYDVFAGRARVPGRRRAVHVVAAGSRAVEPGRPVAASRPEAGLRADRRGAVHPRPAGARQPGPGRTPSPGRRAGGAAVRARPDDPAAPNRRRSCAESSPTCARPCGDRGGDLVIRRGRPGDRGDEAGPVGARTIAVARTSAGTPTGANAGCGGRRPQREA